MDESTPQQVDMVTTSLSLKFNTQQAKKYPVLRGAEGCLTRRKNFP